MSWYEVVEGSDLMQGDILTKCPIPLVRGLDAWKPEVGAPLDVDVLTQTVCVLSQSCDIENDKVEDIVVCQVIEWATARKAEIERGNQFAKATQFREALVAGNVPGVSLLHKHEADPVMPWSLADFHHLSVVGKEVLRKLASDGGRRLRLVPPYREHLGQAFARYFMRVGLPHDAKEFVAEGKA